MKRQFTGQSAVVLGFVLAVAGTAWGNGEEFFEPAPTDKPINLVYVGRVRDNSTRRLIPETIHILISDKGSGLDFPFINDTLGHYRSPDVGAAVRDLRGKTVDNNNLSFEVSVPGYKAVKLDKAPRKTKGIVEVNFTLERESGAALAVSQPVETAAASPAPPTGGDAAVDSGAARGSGAPGDAGGGWGWLALAGGVAVVIAGAGVRTLVHRLSTTR